jgi:hypothetical protein
MLTVLILTQLAQAQRAAERIQQAQYCAAVELRAQHREIVQAQPVSHLEPELVEAHRRFQEGT